MRAKTEFAESQKVKSRVITLPFPNNNEIVISAQFMCQSRLRRELLLPESLKQQSNPFILINNHENHIPEIRKKCHKLSQ